VVLLILVLLTVAVMMRLVDIRKELWTCCSNAAGPAFWLLTAFFRAVRAVPLRAPRSPS